MSHKPRTPAKKGRTPKPARINWDLCGICKEPLDEDKAPRPPLHGAARYVHIDCDFLVAEHIKENWDDLPDIKTFRK